MNQRATNDMHPALDDAGRQLAGLTRRVEALLAAEKNHWLTQPRVPAGVPEGGQWTTDGSGPASGGQSFNRWLRTGQRHRLLNNTLIAQAPGEWHDPRPYSTVSEAFRTRLWERESRGQANHGYSAQNGFALGRYQLGWSAQIEVGLRRPGGAWNPRNRYGVRSEEAFLASPGAQEDALEDYIDVLERQLRRYRATLQVGQRISGIQGNITVTRSGLIAAAHREGAGAVSQYLEHLRENNWRSDFSPLPRRTRERFEHIETRLREFQDVSHRRWTDKSSEPYQW